MIWAHNVIRSSREDIFSVEIKVFCRDVVVEAIDKEARAETDRQTKRGGSTALAQRLKQLKICKSLVLQLIDMASAVDTRRSKKLSNGMVVANTPESVF